MKIRKATQDDADQILKLLVQVNNVHNATRPDLFIKDKTKYTKDELSVIFENASTPVFVAEADRAILGYAFCVFEPHKGENNRPEFTTLYVDDICVDESARRMHVGSALCEYVKSFAKENGCYNITLNVWEGNDAAIEFYKKSGFGVMKYCMEVVL